MRIVFSRKGFDSAAGGGPSPIVGGTALSLPIPATVASLTTYADLGLGDLAARASRGRYDGASLCHHDPMFRRDGTCLFGQLSAAQTHLENQGVGHGDVFLFFGLFREGRAEPHHRIFGYLRVDRMVTVADGLPADIAGTSHPHALAPHGTNDVIYAGKGRQATHASDILRLTVPGGPPTLWNRPRWLKPGGLSYNHRADRWLPGSKLRAAPRGQEFVADIGRRSAPRRWLDDVIAAIEVA